MIRLAFILIVLPVLLAVIAPAAFADRKADLKARFKARLAAIDNLKHAASLGEVFDGSLAAVKDKALADDARKLMTEENADRKELYGIIAAEEKTTADTVGKRNAARNYRVGRPGDWFKLESGEWKQKAG